MDGVREHVALVAIALMLAADGKGLARRPARDQLDPVLPLGQVHMADVFVKQAKIGAHRPVPVFPQSVARIGVALDYCDGIEARFVQAQCEPAASRK